MEASTILTIQTGSIPDRLWYSWVKSVFTNPRIKEDNVKKPVTACYVFRGGMPLLQKQHKIAICKKKKKDAGTKTLTLVAMSSSVI